MYPSGMKPKQLPGCLPKGYTLDSMLTPEQFCLWIGEGKRWWSARRNLLPGIIMESRQHYRIHPRTYLDKRLRTTITATPGPVIELKALEETRT